MRKFFTAASVLASALMTGSSTLALAQDGKIDPERQIMQMIQPGQKLSHAIENLRQQFNNLDIDGNGLSQADADFAEKQQLAEMRAGQVGQLLRYDLDGSGSITREEVVTSMKGNAQRHRRCNCAGDNSAVERMFKREIDRAMTADKDGNGAVSIAEMLQSVDMDRQSRRWHRMNIDAFMTFDANKDSTVTEAEFEEGFTAIFRKVDMDANGVVDIDEYNQRNN